MDLIIQVLAAIGGIGVLIIGVAVFFGNLTRDRLQQVFRLRTELELEKARHVLTPRRIMTERYAESQFDVYLKLWETLQALRLIVDTLWTSATKAGIAELARQVQRTSRSVHSWSLFFEDDEMRELMSVLEVLENFQAGKQRLIDIRSDVDLRHHSIAFLQAEILSQIQLNAAFREQFDDLLHRLRKSFQKKLTSTARDEVLARGRLRRRLP